MSNCCQVYAFESGNVVAPEGVAGVSVTAAGLDVSEAETVVGGEDVCVSGMMVGVSEVEVWVGVFTPLQAATAATSKTINFFIYRFSFTSVASTSTISSDVFSRLLSSAC